MLASATISRRKRPGRARERILDARPALTPRRLACLLARSRGFSSKRQALYLRVLRNTRRLRRGRFDRLIYNIAEEDTRTHDRVARDMTGKNVRNFILALRGKNTQFARGHTRANFYTANWLAAVRPSLIATSATFRNLAAGLERQRSAEYDMQKNPFRISGN